MSSPTIDWGHLSQVDTQIWRNLDGGQVTLKDFENGVYLLCN
jgi:hypothetical protein